MTFMSQQTKADDTENAFATMLCYLFHKSSLGNPDHSRGYKLH